MGTIDWNAVMGLAAVAAVVAAVAVPLAGWVGSVLLKLVSGQAVGNQRLESIDEKLEGLDKLRDAHVDLHARHVILAEKVDHHGRRLDGHDHRLGDLEAGR